MLFVPSVVSVLQYRDTRDFIHYNADEKVSNASENSCLSKLAIGAVNMESKHSYRYSEKQ